VAGTERSSAIAAVLMFHRVADVARDPLNLAVGPARFRAQLERVARRFRPVALDAIADGSATARAVAITLDDGTVDSLDAARILDEVGVPATFFVTTAKLDEPHEAWWDALEQLAEPLRNRLIHARRDERAALIASLPRPPVRPARRVLLAEEVRALARTHAIGAHGVDHLHLPSLPPDERRAELAGCRDTLATLLGRPPTALAYPYGAWDDACVEAARALGFRCAVTVEPRAVVRGDDPLRLPRIDAQPLSPDALEAKLDALLA
jgi:peptidoglycan/xylan/chitin deacetylase (PgdA/CDA1 family)